MSIENHQEIIEHATTIEQGGTTAHHPSPIAHDEVFMTSRKRTGPLGALLTRTLPKYSGPHTVGVCDIELPIEPECYGTFEYKNLVGSDAGITIDTVLFSLFYPTEDENKGYDRVLWFPKLGQTIDGFLKMASRTPNWLYRVILYPLAAACVYGTTFPAYGNAPIKQPSSNDNDEPSKDKWPLIIFSHGVGCSRLMYSALAGELASHGYVVAAVEHRDGTGPSSTITTADGRSRNLDFLSWRDIHWPDLHPQPPDDTTLRHDQLAVRLAEIHHISRILRAISTGAATPVPMSRKSPDWDWSTWSCLDAERPIMMGHSLGGTAALLAASDHERFNFRSVVAYDPAVQRIEPWKGTIPYPLLCINSQEFHNDPDFERTTSLAKTAKSSSIFTISGATHPSFSDVFLILPNFINRMTGLLVSAQEVIDTTISSTLDFLNGNVVAVQRRARTFDNDYLESSSSSSSSSRNSSTSDVNANGSSSNDNGKGKSKQAVDEDPEPTSLDGVGTETENGNGQDFVNGRGKTRRSVKKMGLRKKEGALGAPGTLNYHPY